MSRLFKFIENVTRPIFSKRDVSTIASGPEPLPAKKCVLIAWALVVFLSASLNFSDVVHQRRLHLSPEWGDSYDYDAIALNLARGRGFGYYWSDPEWRAPYERQNQDGAHNVLLARTGSFQRTAFRPPLFPALLALLYKLAGRNFALWRAVNCLIVGFATGFTFAIGYRLGGWAGGFLAALLSLLDPLPKSYAGMFLTEGLAMLAVSALSWTMLNLFLRPNTVRYVVTGVLLALAILTRSIFVLWVPTVFALMLWIEIRLSGGRGRRSLLMLCVALLVLMPWFVRNYIVLRAFMPLGTQGSMELPAGYSDEAVYMDGIWFTDSRKYACNCFTSHTKGVLRERDQARFGLTKAKEWILSNPHLAAKLVYLKIISLWRPSSRYQIFLLALVIIGLLILWRRKEAIVMYSLLAANTLAVGVTWSGGGRFLVPVFPILHSLAAIVLWKLFTWWIFSQEGRIWIKVFGEMMGRIGMRSQELWAVHGKVLAVAVVLLSFIGLALLLSFAVAHSSPSAKVEPEHPAEVNFDDKLMFLGYDVEDNAIQKKSVASWVEKYVGVYAELLPKHRTTFRITYFWRCLEEMEKDYTLMAQFEGYHGKAYRIDQSHQGNNGAYPTSSWREGEIIREEYEVEVPAGYPPIRYTLWIGVQDKEKNLEVLSDVERDEANRVRLGEIEVPPARELVPLTNKPEPQNEVKVEINDELLFLGYDLSERNPRPGDRIRVTTYWQSLRKPERDYAIQVELRNGGYKIRDTMDMAPTRLWEEGRYYQGSAVIAIHPYLLGGTYSLNLELERDDGTERQVSLASLDIPCRRRHIVRRVGKANYRGSEILSPDEPLFLRLKEREALELVVGWTGKAIGEETRVEVYISNIYSRKYLGTWVIRSGRYTITRRRISKSLTLPGRNVIELRVREARDRMDNVGWWRVVDRVFPDLMQDPRTSYDGPIQMDFAQVSTWWEGNWDNYYDLAEVYAERGMMVEVARLYEEAVDKGVEPGLVDEFVLFKRAYRALGEEGEVGEIEERIAERIAHKMSVNLGGKVEFLGYSLTGLDNGCTRVSFFFKCLEEMVEDYALWVHGEVEDESLLEGARTDGGYAIFDHPLPTSRWKVREVHEDDQIGGLRPGRYHSTLGPIGLGEMPGQAFGLRPGRYHFTLGLWRPEDGSRLWREDDPDAHIIDLGWVEVR